MVSAVVAITTSSGDLKLLGRAGEAESNHRCFRLWEAKLGILQRSLDIKLAAEHKLKKVAAIGVSCESTAIGEMAAEGIKRWSRMVRPA